MKKLLSLLTAFSLTAVGASNVIACNKNHTDNGPSASTDIQNLNKIAAIAKEDFDKFLFKKDILGDSSDLSKTYQWVNKDNPSLTLKSENKDQKYVIDYFLNIFQNIFDNTNQKIIDEYPNYYLDSVPLSFDKSDVTIKINFIDLAEIDKKLDLKIDNIDKVKAVRVDFDFKYNVNFKTLTSPEEYDRNFNMTNNFDIFEKLNDGTLNYFQDKLINWLDTIKKINLNEGSFKPLYDEFNIDFSKNNSDIDLVYKNLLKNFIKSDSVLNKIDISYNENTSFINTTSTLFKDIYDKGFYYNTKDIAEKSELTKWGGNNPNSAKVTDFIKQYKEQIVSNLNKLQDNSLNLATFNLKLNYINIYGMTLNGVVKNSEKVVFETNVTLLENDLDKKLTNFGNLIIAFLKFYNVSFEKHYIFEVNQTAFDEIVSEGMNNYSVPKTLFKIFKNSDIAKKMPDIDLFEFICSSLGWGEKKFVYNGDNYLVYHAGGIDGTFLFGNIDTNFKQSSLWYMPFYWFSDNKYEIKKI